jgi:triosephosphate isomerase
MLSVAAVARELEDSVVGVGAQNCHANVSGAHTGDVSAAMVKDAGADYVILGHSERRTDHGETSVEVREKAEAAHGAGVTAIICVGETRQQRDLGAALAVVAEQTALSVPKTATAANTVIAYEPVWAIGTGLVATVEDVEEVHNALRDQLVTLFGTEGNGMRLLYGGSVKPGNAADLLAVANVDGALVGGASLKADDFWAIVTAAT